MKPEVIQRFAAKVRTGAPDECHEWTGLRNKDGYGKLKIDGKTVTAHRLAFRLANGHWPTPCCLHRCDNPPCCNATHLFEGTNADNTADRDAKGRQRGGRGSATRSAKLDECDVLDILFNQGDLSQAERARLYGVSEATVSMILDGKVWSHVTGIRPGQSERAPVYGTAKLTEQDARDIRANAALCRVTNRELALRYGVSATTIGRVVLGQCWKPAALETP